MTSLPTKQPDFARRPFQLVFSYARTYTKALIITIISMLLLVGVQLLVPWIIKILIGAVTTQVASQATMNLIIQLTVVVLVVYILRAGF